MNRSMPGRALIVLIAVAMIGGLPSRTAEVAAALTDCMDATCRVSAGENRGSGCAFERSRGHVLVLTSAHVVEEHNAVMCEFWRHGHQSVPIAGRVCLRSSAADAAVIAIPEAAFGGILPEVIPVSPEDCVLQTGQTVTSVGCVKGGWPTGWKGHVVGYMNGDVCFRPPPADGRSGSAVFDAQGRQIVALLRAREETTGLGVATSVQSLYQAFRQRPTERQTQTCPSDACKPLERLLPNQRSPHGSQPQVWPTLPGAASSAAVDLSETNRKLDRIAELLSGLQPSTEATIPLVPVRPPDNGEGSQRINAAQGAAQRASSQLGELRERLSGLDQVVQKLTGELNTLPERVSERLDKVKSEGAETSREIARAYAKDLLSEKLTDGTLGWSAGKIAGGALGLSGPLALAVTVGAWLVSRRAASRIQGDDPLLVTQLYDRLARRVDDLRDRLGRGDTHGSNP